MLEKLLHRPWDIQSSSPILQPCQGRATPNSHPSDSWDHCWTEPLRPAKLAIHRHSWSLLGHAYQACQDGDPHMHDFFSIGPRPPDLHRLAWSLQGHTPHVCIGLHNLCHNLAPKACQAGNPQRERSPLRRPVLFRHTRPTALKAH
jgi:hypothetical protein